MAAGISALRPLRLLRQPLFWLVLVAVASFYNLWSSGLLEPERSTDAVSYEVVAEAETLGEVFSAVRTYGYPLFLRIFVGESEDFSLLPPLHAAAYLLAVLVFFVGARRYTGSPWIAFAAAFPLCWSGLVRFVQYIQPEVLAPAWALLAVGLLLLLATRPSNPWLWVAVALATFVAYQVRPAYVFLVILVPLMGPLLRLCRESVAWKSLVRWTAGLVAVTFVPLLLYCGVRASVVGHFGLISFGGYELVGIAACFLDDELIDELPAEHRALGHELLDARNFRRWRPYRLGSWTKQWYPQYGKNQWIAEPIVRPLLLEERWASGESKEGTGFDSDTAMVAKWAARDTPPLSGMITVAINERLNDFSSAVVRRRPALYVQWVYSSFVYGLDQVFFLSKASLWLVVAIALSLPFLLFRLRRTTVAELAKKADRGVNMPARLYALFLLAVIFLIGKLSLMVLLSWPFDRYLVMATMLLPAALGASLFELWRMILAPGRTE